MGDQQHLDGSSRQTESDGNSGKISKRRRLLLSLLLLLTIIGIVGFALYVAIDYFGVQWSVVGTAAGGLIVWLVRADIEKRREYEKLLNQQKREQYGKFIEVMNSYLPISDEPERPQPSLSDLRVWSMKLMLVASDDVIRAWNNARLSSEGPEVVRNYGRLLLAMRRDSGHHYSKLKPSDMLESFLNDAHQLRAFFDA